MRREISELAVKKLTTGERITDQAIEGFVARRLPSGKVSFGYQYTDKASGARRWMGIGLHGAVTVKEAREQAKRYAGQVAGHRDPAVELKTKIARSENTVDHVLDRYLDTHVKPEGLRSAVAIEKCFANHVRPALGNKVIYDLERGAIMRMTDELAKRYPRMAHVVLAHLRSAFNWWMLRDEKFRSPIVRGMVKDKTKARARVLTREEIADVWRALDHIEHVPECFAAYLRVLFLTGCRRREVAHMHTRELDGGIWTIPAARYKTKVDHIVPLIPAIKKLLPRGKDGFVFSSDGGLKPLEGFGKPKDELDAAIAAIRRRDKRPPMPAWTFHDLRRTARTILAELKIDRDTAEAVLGHTKGGVEGTYNRHHYLSEKTEALTKLAAHVDRITKAPAPAAAKLRLVAG